MLVPSETISVRSSHRTGLGATYATDGPSSSAPTRRARASGSGAVSCARIHTASPEIRSVAIAVAAAKLVEAGAVITDSAPDAAATAATPASSPHTTIV